MCKLPRITSVVDILDCAQKYVVAKHVDVVAKEKKIPMKKQQE